MADYVDDVRVLGFEHAHLPKPGRVYAHRHDRWYVAFNEPWDCPQCGHRAHAEPCVACAQPHQCATKSTPSDYRWSGLPVMFLYDGVDTYEAALALVREIGAAWLKGDVTCYVGRHAREQETARARARAR